MRCCGCCVASEGSASSVSAAQFDGQGRAQSEPEQGKRLGCPPRPSGHLCKIPGATPEPQPATAGARLGVLGHCRCGALGQVSLETLSDTATQGASGIGLAEQPKVAFELALTSASTQAATPLPVPASTATCQLPPMLRRRSALFRASWRLYVPKKARLPSASEADAPLPWMRFCSFLPSLFCYLCWQRSVCLHCLCLRVGVKSVMTTARTTFAGSSSARFAMFHSAFCSCWLSVAA